MSIKILFLGDIMGRIGREAVEKVLPQLKKEYKPDLIIANGENLAHGTGVSKNTISQMQEAGVDLFTLGNHTWKKNDIYDILAQKDCPVVRPANYPVGVPGAEYKKIEIGSKKLLIVSLLGRIFIDSDPDCPFRKMDEILEQEKDDDLIVLIDFHAEVTSEKEALAYYLDGRVNAVLGTHTHVQTADEDILQKGTVFINDVGMCGAKDAILGLKKEPIIKEFLTQIGQTHEIPQEGLCKINAVLCELGKKGNKIKRINKEVEI